MGSSFWLGFIYFSDLGYVHVKFENFNSYCLSPIWDNIEQKIPTSEAVFFLSANDNQITVLMPVGIRSAKTNIHLLMEMAMIGIRERGG